MRKVWASAAPATRIHSHLIELDSGDKTDWEIRFRHYAVLSRRSLVVRHNKKKQVGGLRSVEGGVMRST